MRFASFRYEQSTWREEVQLVLLLSRLSNISRSSDLAVFVNLQPQLQILPLQRNVGLHQQVHLDKDTVIVVQIARVLEGRSEVMFSVVAMGCAYA